MISALYKAKDKRDMLKHLVVYEEAENYGTNILQHAFQLSLELTTNSPVIRNMEERVLNLSLQVIKLWYDLI